MMPNTSSDKNERQQNVSGKRRDADHERGHAKQKRVGVLRAKVFFLDQLDSVGQALQPAEPPAHACRSQPILNPSGDLALHPNEGEGGQTEDVEQEDRVDQRGQRKGGRRAQSA
jgi:hypothetical protein